MKNCSGLTYYVILVVWLSFGLVITAQPQVKWTFSTDSCVYSSPTYNDGLIYIGSDDGKLYCLDAESGAKKWEYKTSGMIRCKPAVDAGIVFTASDDGNLYAVDAISGTKKWNYNIGNNIQRGYFEQPSPTGVYWDYMQSSPIIDNGVVYVGSGDSCLYAIEAQNGNLKWKTRTKGIIRSSPYVYEGIVYVGSFDGFIYAFDINNGSEVWKFDTHGPNYLHVQSSPRVADGILYCGSRNPYFYAIDAKTGKENWKYSYGGSWVESSATIVDSIVYVGSSDLRRVLAFKAKTGKLLWGSNTRGYPWSSPFYDNGTIYIGLGNFTSTMTGKTGGSIIAINAADGKLKWTVDCGKSTFLGGVVSSPVVKNNTVYYGSLDGKVYAVNTVVTSIKEEQGSIIVPKEYKIENYPNPFNPETKIRFTIPESGKVQLSVFDSLGRQVSELIDKDMNPGTYEAVFNAGSLASGVYYPVLRTGNIIKVTKALYLE